MPSGRFYTIIDSIIKKGDKITKLYLTGDPFTQERHCYYVQADGLSFLVDCGFQRAYEDDELPHLSPLQIRSARYLFLTHSHINQSGALPWLYSHGFSGQVVLTTETARQLPFPVDDAIILEGLSLPCEETVLPGNLRMLWGRSGHCSGSVWFRLSDGISSILFSGDYYDHARIHTSDPIEGLEADLAVLDCEYGNTLPGNRNLQIRRLQDAVSEALADGRPVLLPVPQYGRAHSILYYLHERLPNTDIFGDIHFIKEMGHLDASAMWVRREAQEWLNDIYVRSIPEEFVALGVYFVSDPQLDDEASQRLVNRLLICGGRIIMTGTVEQRTFAASLMHSGRARLLRYGIHCTQSDMHHIIDRNRFGKVIAYHSDLEPDRSVYEF